MSANTNSPRDRPLTLYIHLGDYRRLRELSTELAELPEGKRHVASELARVWAVKPPHCRTVRVGRKKEP